MLAAIAIVVGFVLLGVFADHGLCEIAKAIVVHAHSLERTGRRLKGARHARLRNPGDAADYPDAP